MSSELFFINIPYNCSDHEFRDWIESRGIETSAVRIIRDLVAGVSPAFGYAVLKDTKMVAEAASILNGTKLRNQIVTVKPVAARSIGASSSGTLRRS